MRSAHLALGNQLFAPEHLKKLGQVDVVFMREDRELCTYYRFHKHKIVFFLSAMREYAVELIEAGYKVHYEKLQRTSQKSQKSFEQSLFDFIKANKISKMTAFDIEDKFFEKRLIEFFKKNDIEFQTYESPMFLTSRDIFSKYLGQSKKPFMKTFYEMQRKRLKVLVDEKLNPTGGQWSFDVENRKPLPKNFVPASPPTHKMNRVQIEVAEVTEVFFSEHPGIAHEFWLPTSRAEAEKWLQSFLEQRFETFGDYEDALSKEFPFVSHSVLTPYLNVGLLTPRQVVSQALKIAKKNKIPLASCEGFIRQIIGWREFVRGIYQNFSETQETKNFWGHKKKLSQHWYDGTTGIEPLDDVIKKTQHYAYAHHIERLMVVGSLMLLLEIEPREAHQWFMEMFIDSSDWVMGPNVYGMALFSDGGVFATKPYICGSNYYKKMGPYKSGDWQAGVDGLYWSFIEKHKNFFFKNPRLSMMARSVEKMDKNKKSQIYKQANLLRQKLTR